VNLDASIENSNWLSGRNAGSIRGARRSSVPSTDRTGAGRPKHAVGAFFLRGEVGEGEPGAAALRDDRAGTRNEQPTCSRGYDAVATPADDERPADDPLERRDLVADPRLAVAEPGRGGAEGAFLDHGHEGEEMADLERRPIDRMRHVSGIDVVDADWLARSDDQAVEITETEIEIGGRVVTIEHPPSADELIEESAFEREEFLPYWAELWPSSVALARAVSALELGGLGVLELGCGLALPSVVAALGGGRVLATDWSPDALVFALRNAELNDVTIRTARLAWAEPTLPAGRFDLVLAADVLYERRNVTQLLALLPRLADEVLLADPGRPALPAFLAGAAAEWEVVASGAPELPRGAIHRLRRRAAYA
jgi:predicted nicotinamide N-methyase